MERRLTAILAADIVGYSRLMGTDEVGTLDRLKSLHAECINSKIGEHQGRIVKLTGDGNSRRIPERGSRGSLRGRDAALPPRTQFESSGGPPHRIPDGSRFGRCHRRGRRYLWGWRKHRSVTSARDGGHLWAECYDRDFTDIFAIQDEITHAIVEQLKVKLLSQEKKSIERLPTDNIEAYTYYLRGRDFLHRRSKHYSRIARQMFAKAATLDPKYARAYAGMADCDSFLYLNYRVDVPIDGLLATAQKALSLDDSLAEAHASRGLALSAAQRYDEAKVEFERAIALDPNLFEAYYFYARASFAEGKIEQATRLFERASQIRSDDYQSVCLRIHCYRSLGRIAESKDAARLGLQLAERELALHPDDPRPAHLGAGALFELGDLERAREWVDRALAIDPDDPLTLYNVACGYTKLGNLDAAFEMLERSIRGGGPELANWVKYDSDLDGLRSDPRYQKFVGSIGSK